MHFKKVASFVIYFFLNFALADFHLNCNPYQPFKGS